MFINNHEFINNIDNYKFFQIEVCICANIQRLNYASAMDFDPQKTQLFIALATIEVGWGIVRTRMDSVCFKIAFHKFDLL